MCDQGPVMKRKSLTLIAVVATVVITGATGCGTSGVEQRTPSGAAGTTSSAQPSAAAQQHPECTELNGSIGPAQTCHVSSVTPTYRIDMRFPLDYPDLRTVTDFLKQHRDEFLDWVATFGASNQRGRPYEYAVTAMTFRSGTPESGTHSLVLKISNDTGLAHEGHPNTTFQAFNFDVGKHAPITFDTLFRPGTDPLAVLTPIVRRALNAPTAELAATTYENFAITDEAVIFFFGQDQVVQDNSGPKQVTVPRAELAALLA